MEALDRAGVRDYIVDPIVEPLIVGFVPSLRRYWEVRQRFPDVPMMMGIGNISELTDADSTGINALLVGICQELGVTDVLTTEVAHWARGAVREVDAARRLMHYAHAQRRVPKDLDDSLITLKDATLRPYAEAELREMQAAVSDPNYRIFADQQAIYVFNAQRFVVGTEIQEIFDQLAVDERFPCLLSGQGADEGAHRPHPGQGLPPGAAADVGLPDAGGGPAPWAARAPNPALRRGARRPGRRRGGVRKTNVDAGRGLWHR